MSRIVLRTLLIVSAASLTTGCLTTSPEQQAKANEERCEARGYKRGTDDFADCVVRIDGERAARMESRRREMMERPPDPPISRY